MRYLLALALFALPALAQAGTCTEIIRDETRVTGSLANLDVSSGTVTTGSINPGDARQLMLRVVLTDASDGITSAIVSITEAPDKDSTFGAVAICDGTFPKWLCEPWELDWNPQTKGKAWNIPLPVIYASMKITLTTTGHGAGDEVAYTVRACY